MMATGQPVAAEVATWRWLALAAALLGFFAVLLGAAGSHAIDLSAASAAQRWNTALQIHYFQAASLLALSALSAISAGRASGPSSPPAAARSQANLLLLSGCIQLLGTLIFSGSLYLRAVQIERLPGWITPLGGLILLAGWLLLIGLLTRKIR